MDNFRISKLEVNNIGPFGHLELDFPEKPAGMSDRAEIHILTGENGTGKTTLLEMLVLGIKLNPSTIESSNKFRFHNQESSVKIDFGAHAGYLQFYKNMKPESKVLPESISTSFWNYHYAPNLPYSIAFFAYSGYRRIGRISIESIQELQGHPFNNALGFHSTANPQDIIQWIANSITKQLLAKNQNDKKAAERFEKAITNLQDAISGIIEKPVRFSLEFEPLNVIVEVDHETLDFNLLPDGLKSIISWIADLLMRMDRVKWENDTPVFERNFILFLDEIEVHLHPAWQRKILPAVQKLFPNAQIFISTHSPFVVGSVDGAWIHKFVKPNGDSRLAGPPILSEDAKSFRYWLEAVFDIKKEFGEGAQRQLDRFYDLRNRLLVNGTPQEREEFIHIAGDLSRQSPEMESIISWEIRQFNKRSPQPVSI